MDALSHTRIERRKTARRQEDRLHRGRVEKYDQLLMVGQIITSEMNMDRLFEVIMEQTNRIMESERSTVFLYDEKGDELWSLAATGMGKNEIRFPAGHGVAGWVLHHRSPLIINDPYSDPRFFPGVDRKTGFRTRSIISTPIVTRKNACIGVMQVLNKRDGGFTDQDEDLLRSITNYVAIALENARLYEDLRLMNKARERIIDHLSHELKTPLALLSGVLARVEKAVREDGRAGLEKTIQRGKRSLDRLRDLEEKIEDIIHQKSTEEKRQILSIVEDAASFVEEQCEENAHGCAVALELIAERIEDLFSLGEPRPEEILLPEFLSGVCNEAAASMEGREVGIAADFQEGVRLYTDRVMLGKVCRGLLRNAIENTPDEGRVELRAFSEDSRALIRCRDYGMGITEENQKIIFQGFFHTQDTESYSSKRPYQFNAGGSGADLLRARCFSERFGFSLDFESTRCRFIPNDTDVCPGRISACSRVSGAAECMSAGGSVFTLAFPLSS